MNDIKTLNLNFILNKIIPNQIYCIAMDNNDTIDIIKHQIYTDININGIDKINPLRNKDILNWIELKNKIYPHVLIEYSHNENILSFTNIQNNCLIDKCCNCPKFDICEYRMI